MGNLGKSVDPDQNAASDHGQHCLLCSKISTKRGDVKNQPDTPYIGDEPVQRVQVGEFNRHKWVNIFCIAPR